VYVYTVLMETLNPAQSFSLYWRNLPFLRRLGYRYTSDRLHHTLIMLPFRGLFVYLSFVHCAQTAEDIVFCIRQLHVCRRSC